MTVGVVTRTADTQGSASLVIPVTPNVLWPIVSDPTGMGKFSPENSGARWHRGVTGPAVGAKFRGTNRRGPLFWYTECVVTECTTDRMFAFDVTFPPMFPLIAKWTWLLEPRTGGEIGSGPATKLTLSWQLPHKLEMPRQLMWTVLGVGDRPTDLTAGSARTLLAIRAFVTN